MVVVILGFVALFFLFVIIFQIAKAGELLSIIKGEGEGEVNYETNRFASLFLIAFMVLGLVGIAWSVFHYKHAFLPEAASQHGVALDNIFNITLFFTGVVFVITQILLFYFAYRYRAKKGRKAYYYPHNNKLEVVWTVVPAIVLTVLIIMGLKAWFKTTGDEPEGSLVVEAIGQQFNWTIRYPGKDKELGKTEFEEMSVENSLGIVWTDEKSHDDFLVYDTIHLPVNKPVLFKLGSKDVLHSFYLPHFRIKQDCVPGIPTRFWMKPTITTAAMREKLGDDSFNFELACAELCGEGHWTMRKVVVIESEEAFNKWYDKQTPAYDNLSQAQREEIEKASGNIAVKENEQDGHEASATAL